MFLPDRFVKGECPNCGAADQYGDTCEVCGATYAPTDLKNPRSVVSGATPELRESEHYFFQLGDFAPLLEQLARATSASQCRQCAQQARRVVRRRPARLGHLARRALLRLRDPRRAGQVLLRLAGRADRLHGELQDYAAKAAARRARLRRLHWRTRGPAGTELHHFIGKDIVYFHGLFWPAMLHGAGFRMPTALHVHGFLTVNGAEDVEVARHLHHGAHLPRHLTPEYLRYYFAAKLGAGVDDIDLNLEDFVARVNSDLVGKFVNIASRCAGFITKRFDGRLADGCTTRPTMQRIVDAPRDAIAAHYEAREFGQAMREIMALADQANQYIDDERSPGSLAKEPGSEAERAGRLHRRRSTCSAR